MSTLRGHVSMRMDRSTASHGPLGPAVAAGRVPAATPTPLARVGAPGRLRAVAAAVALEGLQALAATMAVPALLHGVVPRGARKVQRACPSDSSPPRSGRGPHDEASFYNRRPAHRCPSISRRPPHAPCERETCFERSDRALRRRAGDRRAPRLRRARRASSRTRVPHERASPRRARRPALPRVRSGARGGATEPREGGRHRPERRPAAAAGPAPQARRPARLRLSPRRRMRPTRLGLGLRMASRRSSRSASVESGRRSTAFVNIFSASSSRPAA